MRRWSRLAAMGLVGALGFGTAAIAAGGDDGVRACASKRTGEIRAQKSGRCGPGSFAITISGEAFKRSRGGTLTINGVAFKSSRGGTLTINGNTFRRGGGQTLTINGTSFQGTLPNTLTINGTSFERGAGGTLTINGTQVAAQGPPGPAGPAGAEGRAGPQGPTGLVPGPAPVSVAGPVTAVGGQAPATLASVTYSNSDGVAHRLLLTGGFQAACNKCTDNELVPAWRLLRAGASGPLVTRRLATVADSPPEGQSGVSATISEVIVTPAVCGPCTFSVVLAVPAESSGATQARLDATEITLGLIDLGPLG